MGNHLACPDDGAAPLTAAGRDGELVCPRCRRRFPSHDGIWELLPASLVAPQATTGSGDVAARRCEMDIRDRESAIYDELYADDEFRYELATYVRLLDPQRDDVILDVGAGTGRVVKEYASRCAAVSCADYSRQSLRFLLARKDLDPRRIEAVLADATALPFAERSFDRVVSLSMLCFLPSDALRHQFLAHVRRVLRPGGVFVVSTYHYAAVKRLWAAFGRTEGALPSGLQSGGISYRNETEADFRRDLEAHFAIEELRGVCHRVPFVSRASRRLSCRLDAYLGGIDAARKIFATEIVARCSLRAAA